MGLGRRPVLMPNEGQRRPARHAGRVDRFSNGRLRVSWRAGCTTAGSAASLVRGRSTPGHERVEAWAPERAASQVAQNHARSEADLRISIDRPDDPLDIRWLDGRYVAQSQARELAEPESRVQRLRDRRQIGLERGPAASERRPGGRRSSGRFAPSGGTRPRRQPGEWTAIQRPQRRVAWPQQRARVYAGGHRPARM